MAGKYLGNTFDIHGGGIDLRFPHHENEQAQSRAAGRGFARYWMHNGWVTAAGEKMSKSLGNGALVSEVTKQYPGRAVRFYLLAPHYRSAIEFSDSSLAEATASLARVDAFLGRFPAGTGFEITIPASFGEAMNNDLGTPAAVAVLYTRVKEGNQALDRGDQEAALLAYAQVRSMLTVFGLDPEDPVWAASSTDDLSEVVDALVGTVLEQRQAARERKDWASADALRDALTNAGLKIEDTPQGPRWSRITGA